MKFLMLRGQVPQDRDPQEIVFDKIEDVDDVWTQLFFALLEDDDQGELWYWNGERTKKFTENFTERWVPSFVRYKSTFTPDVIFCRGGFQEYHPVLYQYPKAIKIYYGAGNRFLPNPMFSDYNIILQDSIQQLETCKKMYPEALTTLFVKPAADNIFYPVDVEKEFDVCFPANASQRFKGHEFVYGTVPSDIKLLTLGNRPDRYKHPDNVTAFRSSRTDMAKHISKCRVGIVAVKSTIDSCPRVIPEMLACGIPIVVLDDVRFWKEKYIKSILSSSSKYTTGELVPKSNFWDMVRFILANIDDYNPRKYYEENLSLDHAARFIREKINEVSV